MTLVLVALVLWAALWWLNTRLAARGGRAARMAVPLIFGATILIVWELVVRGLGVPTVILPPPSQIAATFAANMPTLWADFVQTILNGAMSGYLIGCLIAVLQLLKVERPGLFSRRRAMA